VNKSDGATQCIDVRILKGRTPMLLGNGKKRNGAGVSKAENNVSRLFVTSWQTFHMKGALCLLDLALELQ